MDLLDARRPIKGMRRPMGSGSGPGRTAEAMPRCSPRGLGCATVPLSPRTPGEAKAGDASPCWSGLPEQVPQRPHEDAGPDGNQVVRKIVVRIVQARMVLAGTQEEHRRCGGVAEAPEILRGTHRSIPAIVRNALGRECPTQMRHRLRGVLAMVEDVVIGDLKAEAPLGC